MATESQNNIQDNVFQTPNPAELKSAAKEDPIHKRDGASETEAPESGTRDDAEIGRENAVDLANSHVVKANISAH